MYTIYRQWGWNYITVPALIKGPSRLRGKKSKNNRPGKSRRRTLAKRASKRARGRAQ